MNRREAVAAHRGDGADRRRLAGCRRRALLRHLLGVLSAVQFFPLIGKRHRHPRWDELNQRSGRK